MHKLTGVSLVDWFAWFDKRWSLLLLSVYMASASESESMERYDIEWKRQNHSSSTLFFGSAEDIEIRVHFQRFRLVHSRRVAVFHCSIKLKLLLDCSVVCISFTLSPCRLIFGCELLKLSINAYGCDNKVRWSSLHCVLCSHLGTCVCACANSSFFPLENEDEENRWARACTYTFHIICMGAMQTHTYRDRETEENMKYMSHKYVISGER